MKKILILLAVAALAACDKNKEEKTYTLSQEEQELENSALIGTWRENSIEPVAKRRQVFIFSEDFKLTNYSFLDSWPESSLGYIRTDEPYTIPEKGTIDFVWLENYTWKYEIKDGILYVTDAFTFPCEKVE